MGPIPGFLLPVYTHTISQSIEFAVSFIKRYFYLFIMIIPGSAFIVLLAAANPCNMCKRAIYKTFSLGLLVRIRLIIQIRGDVEYILSKIIIVLRNVVIYALMVTFQILSPLFCSSC